MESGRRDRPPRAAKGRSVNRRRRSVSAGDARAEPEKMNDGLAKRIRERMRGEVKEKEPLAGGLFEACPGITGFEAKPFRDV